MKRILLYGLLLLSGAASAQIINFPDANLKTRLLSEDLGEFYPASGWDQNGEMVWIDSNSNGEIEIAEAQAIYGLNISGAYISDLTGLDAFINVQWIQCGNNHITSLDAAAIFPNLKNLMCSQNPLTTLNITGLSQLESLHAEGTQLSDLNVTGLQNLKVILCSGIFTTIDLTGLIALEEFICGETPLTTLDFHDNINLRDVAISGTLITELDLSNCPQITILGCKDNLLLETINLHNGGLMLFTSECSFINNPNLNFICVDEGEQSQVEACTWDEAGPPSMSATCSLGTSDFIADNLKIYPNPSKDIVIVDGDTSIGSLQLYDMQGRMLENVSVNETSVILDLSGRASGNYFLKITTEKGVKVEKLIRE